MPLQCSGVLRHCCGIRISGQHAKRTGRHAFAVADYSSPFLVSAGGRKCPTGAPRRQELGFTGEDLDDFEEIARMLGREKVRVRSFNGSVLCDHGVLGVEAWVTNAHVRGPPFARGSILPCTAATLLHTQMEAWANCGKRAARGCRQRVSFVYCSVALTQVRPLAVAGRRLARRLARLRHGLA